MADQAGLVADACGHEHGHAPAVAHDSRWQHGAKWAYRLAWVSMVAMLTEGVVGLWQGLSVGSIALTGWALGSLPEALASAMVAWRFSGSRTASATAERRAQLGVAWSFWLTAPYIAAESVHHILDRHDAETSIVGIVLTALSLVLMPILGRAKHSLAERLGSAATAGRARRTTCAAPRPRPSWSAWRSPRSGPASGGSTRRSVWASPPPRSGRASSPGAARTAADGSAVARVSHGETPCRNGQSGRGPTRGTWPAGGPTVRVASSRARRAVAVCWSGTARAASASSAGRRAR